MVSLVAELRGYERQAAEELGQWKTCVDERKPPRRIARRRSRLALLMTAGLEELEKRSLEMEIAGRGQPGGQMSQAVNLLRAIVSLPE